MKSYDALTSLLTGFGLFNPTEWIGIPEDGASIDHLNEKVCAALSCTKHLLLWSEYCQVKKATGDLGLAPIAEAVEKGELAGRSAKSQLYYSIYQSIAKELVRSQPILSRFSRTTYDNVRDRISRLDESIQKRSRERIAFTLSLRPVPNGISSGYVSNYTDRSLIEHEIGKKKRHIPIRQLVRRASDALLALKPCFMMSPQSVAQYLDPLGPKFDMVVMDEASQLRLEDAIGAIARTSQAVIVGDPKQLPPTIFFERLLESDDQVDEQVAAEESESILDICRTTFDNRRLKWHYRSEHEQLISFSNNEFYDNDLIVFPAPLTSSDEYGVKHHFVRNGTYQKGKNRGEAEVVARAILEHFQKYPQLTLGVATFNIEQRDLIQDEIERLQKKHAWLEKAIAKTEESEQPFFVKNLENVQGDERDVIFISTTYGPDVSTNQVYQRFGPLTLPMGWRRLNVIVTRAKKRLDLFTSMKPSDIRIAPGTSQGVIALRKYIEFAEKGTIPEFGGGIKEEADSDFEISVYKTLESAGYKGAFQVGVAGFFIDIGVYHPLRDKEFILGIECDGATYHRAKSIRDRDILRQKILEAKGWKIYRIWSTDWFKNTEKEKKRLLDTLSKLVEKDKIRIHPVKTTVQKEPKGDPATSLDQSSAMEDELLRKALIEFRDQKIELGIFDSKQGILSEELLDAFIRYRPTTKEEFLEFSLALRDKISASEGRYLDEILDIIENVVG